MTLKKILDCGGILWTPATTTTLNAGVDATMVSGDGCLGGPVLYGIRPAK
jgi:hypothetical protein